MSAGDKRVTVYRLSSEDVERLLTAKYGGKLMAVNHASLARQNEKRAKWLKSVGSETGSASGDQRGQLKGDIV